jgi:hypothetical protein
MFQSVSRQESKMLKLNLYDWRSQRKNSVCRAISEADGCPALAPICRMPGVCMPEEAAGAPVPDAALARARSLGAAATATALLEYSGAYTSQ